MQKLDAERQEILGEPDHTVAAQKARLFHKKYRPYFENALIHQGVEGNVIQTALLDKPETSESINALTQIIPLTFTNLQ